MNVAFISNNRMTCMYILYSGGASENGGHLLIKDICAQSHECPLLSGLTVVRIHGSVRCTFKKKEIIVSVPEGNSRRPLTPDKPYIV